MEEVVSGDVNNSCFECDSGTMHAVGAKSVPWDSLPGVIIEGVEHYECDRCGEVEVEYQRMAELVDTIARALILKPGRLDGAEIRFLRKSMGWSGRDFAARLNMSPEHVSRWENGHERIGRGSDTAVRLLFAFDKKITDYSSERVAEASRAERSGPRSLAVRRDEGGHWHTAA